MKIPNGIAAAPPVPAFPSQKIDTRVVTKVSAAAAAPLPLDAELRYEKSFVLPKYYIKYLEPVYDGFENFSFEDLNYEIMEKDIKFLTRSEKNGTLLNLSHHDFEKVIDIFEKIVFLGESQSKEHLVNRFLERAPKEYLERIPRATLEAIY